VKVDHDSWYNTTKEFPDKLLKEYVELCHMALKMAWEGKFDFCWDSPGCHDIDGKSQRDHFFDNVTRGLTIAEKEALRRRLHLSVAARTREEFNRSG
jgi:hypothetical protein